MRSHRFYRSFLSVFVTTTFLVFVSAIMLLWIAHDINKTGSTEHIHALHDSTAQALSQETALFFDMATLRMRTLRDTLVVTSPTGAEASALLDYAIGDSPEFEYIRYVDINGVIIAGSQPSDRATDFHNHPALSRIVKGETYISPILFRGVVPFVQIAFPVTRLNRPIGFLAAEINVKEMWWWFDAINRPENTTLLLVEEQGGRIVGDSLKQRLGERIALPPFVADTAPVGQKGSVAPGPRLRIGDDVRSIFKLVDYPFFVVLSTPMEPFSRKLSQRLATLALGALLLLVLSTVLAYYAAQRSSRPARSLIDTMRRFPDEPRIRADTDLPSEFGVMADTFNAMADRLESQKAALIRQESQVSLGKMAAAISHEYRASLQAIMHVDHLIEKQPEKARDLLKHYTREACDDTIGLMEFAHAGIAEKREFDVGLLLLMAKDTLCHTIPDGEGVVDVQRPDPEITVVGDRRKLMTALKNCARNAFEAGAERVLLSCRASEEEVVFSIVDDGPGVPADVAERIFEPFYSTKERGFGLGMAIVDLVAIAHDGSASIHSTGPEGTEIRITIPRPSIPPER
jgi:signal transduction histidine kinase